MQWWYGLINEQEKSQLHTLSKQNWLDETCRPDVLVLIETDQAAWLSYMKKRGRSDDNDPECVRQYDAQKRHMADSAERYARENGIPFVKYINTPGVANDNAKVLAQIISHSIPCPVQQSAESNASQQTVFRCRP